MGRQTNTPIEGFAALVATVAMTVTACHDGVSWRAERGADAAPPGEISDAHARQVDAEPVGPSGSTAGLVAAKGAMYEREADAGEIGEGAAERGPFMVGDSTMVEAAAATGLGSAYSGHGFTDEAALGLRNPLDAPPDGYDGLVVLGVSLWDVWASDLSGYRKATDHYRDLGFDVVWIEVPPAGVEYDGGPLNPELEALNVAVAEQLGCEIQPWAFRDVETFGSAGDPDADRTHPTPAGGLQISLNVATLTEHHVCNPTSPV